MVQKIRKTKGVCPRQPKTLRTLIPTETRFAMLSDKVSGMGDYEIGRKHNKNRRQVLLTITKARERAERYNRPILDQRNVQETPGKWGRKRTFSEVAKEDIARKVLFLRESRKKTAQEWIEDLSLDCSISTFTRLMYEKRLHYLPGGEKPELNPGCMHLRNQLAKTLLSMDFKQCVFIDEANQRSEYGKEKSWHSPDEYLHPDVKQKTQKQDYSKAEFIGAIKWGEPPGPYKVFKTETLDEKKEAEVLINRLQEEQLPQLQREFDKQEARKDVSLTTTTIYIFC